LARIDSARPPTVEVRAVCDCTDLDVETVRKYAADVMVATGHDAFELSVLLADDTYVRELNQRYRGVDRTTNVLAFPQQDSLEALPGPALLGDVVISVEKARRDSARAGHSLLDELKKLTVHGILHLSGHDHRTGSQARRMRQLEQEVTERIR